MIMNDRVDCGTFTQLKSVGFLVDEGLFHSATTGHYVSVPKQDDIGALSIHFWIAYAWQPLTGEEVHLIKAE